MSRTLWPDRREEIERLIAEGWSRRAIASFYGVSKQTFRAACCRIGVVLPQAPVTRRIRQHYFLPKPPEPKPMISTPSASYTEDGREITVWPPGYATGAIDADRYTVKPRGKKQ